MDLDLITATAPSVLGPGLLCLVFGYFWSVYRERSLALWSIAWGLWAVRRGWGIVAASMQFVDTPAAVYLLVGAYVSLMLVGTAEFTGRSVARIWFPLLGGALTWAILTPDFGRRGSATLVFVTVVAIGWIWAGLLFLRADRSLGAERYVPGIAMILMGLDNFLIPIFQDEPAHILWGTALVAALQTLIAVGLLIVLHRRVRVRLVRTHRRIEDALANVLEDFLPVCARCKMVRGDGEWVELETWLEERTAVSLGRSTCPNCAVAGGPE